MRLKKLNTIGYRLLAYYWKKIGFIVFLAASIFSVCTSNIFFSWPENFIILKRIISNIGLLALFVMILSENKNEDELTHLMRLRSLASAFFYGVIMVILSPYWHLLFDGKFEYQVKGEEVIFMMFGMYFLFYYLDRKGR